MLLSLSNRSSALRELSLWYFAVPTENSSRWRGEGKKNLSQKEGFPNHFGFCVLGKAVWRVKSLQCMFFHGKSPLSWCSEIKNQRCFPVHALPYLSMLLGLWHRRLSCFIQVIFIRGKWNTLLFHHQEGHVPLYCHYCHSFQFHSDGGVQGRHSIFCLGIRRAGVLLSIHHWAAEEIHFNCAGASHLKPSSPSFSTDAVLAAEDLKIAFGLSFDLQ